MISPRRTCAALGAALLTLAIPAVARAQVDGYGLYHYAGSFTAPCYYEGYESPIPLSATCTSQVDGMTRAYSSTSSGRFYSLSTSGSGIADQHGYDYDYAHGAIEYLSYSTLSFTGATPAQLYFYYTLAWSGSSSGASSPATAGATAQFWYLNQYTAVERLSVLDDVSSSEAFNVTDLGNGVHRGEVQYAGDGLFEIYLNTGWQWIGSGEGNADLQFRYLGMDAVDAEGNSLAGCTDSLWGDCHLGLIDSPAPEPASIILMVTGIGVLVPFVRRRKTGSSITARA